MKINWSGRSHNFSKADLGFLNKIIQSADPLTQGKYQKLFEKNFGKVIGKKNVFAVSSAAAALEIIALLLKIKKVMKLLFQLILIVPLLFLSQEMGQKLFGLTLI